MKWDKSDGNMKVQEKSVLYGGTEDAIHLFIHQVFIKCPEVLHHSTPW